MNTYTDKFDKSEFDKIKKFFCAKNAQLSEQQYAVFKAKVDNITAVLYTSGKFVLQGQDVSELAQEIQNYTGKTTLPNINEVKQPQIDIPLPHIGVDESGKGDFFGPLVIAGVLADENNAERFIEAGIKDSKKLSDEKILKLAGIIKANSIHSVVVVGNEKYNQLYSEFSNLNKLLAWGHARVIENILEKKDCNIALSDKFGNESLIKNALLKKGQSIILEQRVRAEEDIAVAAASVIARAEYVKKMQSLSARYEIDFPKGASEKVLQAGKQFILRYGKEKLNCVAKTHFKTYTQINTL